MVYTHNNYKDSSAQLFIYLIDSVLSLCNTFLPRETGPFERARLNGPVQTGPLKRAHLDRQTPVQAVQAVQAGHAGR